MLKYQSYFHLHTKVALISTFAVFVFSFSCFSLNAQTLNQPLPKILWVINDAPPFYILNGKLKKQGFGDLVQKAIINQLPQYNHSHKIIPLKRVLLLLKAKKPLCFSTWIHDTRADLVTTSIPYLVYEPHGIIIDKEQLKKTQQSLSLKALLKNKTLTFGIPAGRGFGERLDGLINDAKGYANIYRRAGQDSTEGIFKMLASKRIDFILEYSYTFKYFKNSLNLHDNLSFVPLSEQVQDPPLGAIACTNTPWGEQRINDINMAIKSIRKTEQFRKILTKWFVFDNNKSSYWQIFNSLVVKPFP
ncbi:MAG: TIGR02285 family protein [Oceanospirillaceae bacterium]|nr:TIGR02285 family protein [Oceanospirillaceae bacterium]